MTGITFEAATETYGKRLQLLKEILPNVRNVAVLAAEGDANVTFAMQSLDKAAPALGVTLTSLGCGPVTTLRQSFVRWSNRMRKADCHCRGPDLRETQDCRPCAGAPSAILSCILRDGQGRWIGEPRTGHPAMAQQGLSISTRYYMVQNPVSCLYSSLRTTCSTLIFKQPSGWHRIPPTLLVRADEVIE